MRARVLGVPIDPLTMRDAVERIVQRAAEPGSRPAYVLKPYVEFFGRRAGLDAQEIFEGAWLCLADGVAIQWAAAYAQRTSHRAVDLVRSLAEIVLRPKSVTAVIPERTAGITFTLALLEACRDRGLGVFLIGSPKAGSVEVTAQHLVGRVPGLHVVGTAPGRVDAPSEAATLERLRRAAPDVILVGLGFPLQERLMARLAERLEHGVLIGEGGSFDFREFGGRIRRAPPLLRRLGLEWLWRLAREPSRLRRQLEIPRFVMAVQRQARR